MRRKSIFVLIMFFCATPVSAVIFNDGGTHVVDSNLGIDVPITVDNESHLIFNEGGIARAISCQNGRVNMNGGWLHMGFTGWNNSRIDMYGGTTSVTYGNGCSLKNQAIARIFDGIVKQSFGAYDQSQAFIYGGELQSNILALDESEISISGGIINGDLIAREGTIIISGTGFNYDYGEISDLSGMLTGTLDNGDSINSWFYRQDNAGNGNYGTVILVPEADKVLLFDPNGGEELVAGATYHITWETESSIENVLIEYSADDGQGWNEVNTVPNNGSYEWIVPDVTSANCLVRISDASYPSWYDTSDDMFTIYVCTLAYDLNHNCFVDFSDFAFLVSEWLQCGNPFDSNCIP
ncbi:MAG: hypothetical protein ACYSUY_17110 [Planctomycetota bacterium]